MKYSVKLEYDCIISLDNYDEVPIDDAIHGMSNFSMMISYSIDKKTIIDMTFIRKWRVNEELLIRRFSFKKTKPRVLLIERY